MIKKTQFTEYKLIVTQLLRDCIFAFDNGRGYDLNKASLDLTNLDYHLNMIGRPDPYSDTWEVLFLPIGMKFLEWVEECRVMALLAIELGIKDYPFKPTPISVQKIRRGKY